MDQLHAQTDGLASQQLEQTKRRLAKSARQVPNAEMDRQFHRLAHLANLLPKDQANASGAILASIVQEILLSHRTAHQAHTHQKLERLNARYANLVSIAHGRKTDQFLLLSRKSALKVLSRINQARLSADHAQKLITAQLVPLQDYCAKLASILITEMKENAHHARQATTANLVNKRRDAKLVHFQKQELRYALSAQQATSAKKLPQNQWLAASQRSALKEPRRTKNEW